MAYYDRAGYLSNYGNQGSCQQGAHDRGYNSDKLVKRELHYVETRAENQGGYDRGYYNGCQGSNYGNTAGGYANGGCGVVPCGPAPCGPVPCGPSPCGPGVGGSCPYDGPRPCGPSYDGAASCGGAYGCPSGGSKKSCCGSCSRGGPCESGCRDRNSSNCRNSSCPPKERRCEEPCGQYGPGGCPPNGFGPGGCPPGGFGPGGCPPNGFGPGGCPPGGFGPGGFVPGGFAGAGPYGAMAACGMGPGGYPEQCAEEEGCQCKNCRRALAACRY